MVHLPCTTIANFDFKMVSKNCTNFVLNCAAIFKFESQPPIADFRYRDGVKKIVLILCYIVPQF